MGCEVTILKDDGCNTNVLSREFVRRHFHLMKIHKTNLIGQHSNKALSEQATEAVVNAELEMGDHIYRSNWVVAHCCYEVLLGMAWHTETVPEIDYAGKKLKVGGTILQCCSTQSIKPTVTPLGIKKLRSFLRRGNNNFRLYLVSNTQIIWAKEAPVKSIDASKDPDKRTLTEEFSEIFRDDLPPALPLKRCADYVVDTENESKPPFRPIFQLPPAELSASKEYITDLLKKGKIRPSRSPFGAPLFFVKKRMANAVA